MDTVNWVMTTPSQYEENSQISTRSSIQSSIEPSWGQPPPVPSFKQSNPPSPLSPKRLTDEDRIHILQLSIQHRDAYGRDTDKAFFQKIAYLFAEATGEKH